MPPISWPTTPIPVPKPAQMSAKKALWTSRGHPPLYHPALRPEPRAKRPSEPSEGRRNFDFAEPITQPNINLSSPPPRVPPAARLSARVAARVAARPGR